MTRRRARASLAVAGALALGLLVSAGTASGAPLPVGAEHRTAATAGQVWHPRPGTTWQWQIDGRVDTTVPGRMYDVDLFDAAPGGTNAGIVRRLHRSHHVVVCYLDTGAWESYRPDAAQFPRSVIGNQTYASNGAAWKGEHWLDIRRQSWHLFAPIIWRRLDLAVRLGCDGVEPDQNNPWGNHPGFPISRADEKTWYLEVARQAHRRGLSVGMKNGVEVVDADTVRAFDWALNEECFQYHECGVYAPFVAAHKAVFQVEYVGSPARFCPRARALGFSSMKKHLSLGPWRVTCW